MGVRELPGPRWRAVTAVLGCGVLLIAVGWPVAHRLRSGPPRSGQTGPAGVTPYTQHRGTGADQDGSSAGPSQAVDTTSGISPTVTRLELGNFAAPAPGVTVLGPESARTLTMRRAAVGSFNAVGVTWAADPWLGAVVVTVRAHVPGQDWGAPRPALLGAEVRQQAAASRSGVGRGGADLVWVGAGDGVEVNVTVRVGGRRPGSLSI